MARLWGRDAALWTGADEARWMGWLDAPRRGGRRGRRARRLRAGGARAGLHRRAAARHGGIEPVPRGVRGDVRAGRRARRGCTCSTRPTRRRWRAVERLLDPAGRSSSSRASRAARSSPTCSRPTSSSAWPSGWARARAAARFVAITDPGSSLERLAAAEGFLRTFAGVPSIGGRFSALSNFGIVPAAVMGLDVAPPGGAGGGDGRACGADRPVADNPGARLGLALGVAARAGRDKVTIVASPGIADLGAWLEQLIAESTGKQGKALIPVAGERLGPARGLRRRPRVRLPAPRRRGGRRARTRAWTRSSARAIPSSASRSPTATTSPASSSAGRSRRRWPAPSSASTPSTSRTWRRARWPRAA